MAESRVRGPGEAYAIRAVERTCLIIDTMTRSTFAVSLEHLAEVVDLPKQTVFRYLVTLSRLGWVEQTPLSSSYRIGRRFPVRPLVQAERVGEPREEM